MNEDAFLADDRPGLFIVCDGVGGRRSGEIAAGEAISIIQEYVGSAMLSGSSADGVARHSIEDIRGLVRFAMQQASRAIFDLGLEDLRYAGMCTTASVMLIVGELAVIGHVGDTRVYHARGHSTRQLTEDHTLLNIRVQQGLLDVERAKNRKSPITRALGLRDSVEVDIHTARLMPGDRLLLCTDGLHEHLQPEAILTRLFQMDLPNAALAAIGHARRCGGKDNATAIFVEALGHA
jgi:serine/threonine protein phosphatase PrpC